MCFALRVFHLASPPCELCRGQLGCVSGSGRACPLKLLLNLLQPGLNSGEAEGCELRLLPNLPQTVLMYLHWHLPRLALPPQGRTMRPGHTQPAPNHRMGKANHCDLIPSALRACLSLSFYFLRWDT